jgi:hypothetical protein
MDRTVIKSGGLEPIGFLGKIFGFENAPCLADFQADLTNAACISSEKPSNSPGAAKASIAEFTNRDTVGSGVSITALCRSPSVSPAPVEQLLLKQDNAVGGCVEAFDLGDIGCKRLLAFDIHRVVKCEIVGFRKLLFPCIHQVIRE